VLERLKSVFRRSGPEVEYKSQADQGPVVIPAGPPAGQIPPVAPVDDPLADTEPADDKRS
jgi:hypothetical protein